MSSGLVVALCVVDGHGQLGGHLLLQPVVQYLRHLLLTATHVGGAQLLGAQQVHHQLVDLHFLLVTLVGIRLDTQTDRQTPLDVLPTPYITQQVHHQLVDLHLLLVTLVGVRLEQ